MARPRKNDDLRHGRHCVFALHAHWVFVTKYRRNVFKKEHLDAMHIILAKVCKDFDAQLVEFNGEHDHGGAPIDILRQYIEEQQAPH